MKRRVVVVGIGIITSHGVGQDENWQKIKSGLSSISEVSCFDASIYRTRFAGEAKCFKECDSIRNLKKRRLDRASHLLIDSAYQALSHAGLYPDMINEPVLVSLGTTLGGMISGEQFHKEAMVKSFARARLSLLSDYMAHNQSIKLLAELGLEGNFLVFSNACASGTNAIGHAFHSLRAGDYNFAICGGYDTLSEFTFAGFNSLMALSPSLCKPFDKNRDGLVLGEGAGILVLEEEGHALKRGAEILCEVSGYGETSDAYHITRPDPCGTSAAKAITKAINDAGNPSIDYINAHGTATKYNDAMEANALTIAFGERAGDIPTSSIKPMIGHLLGAAGAVEAISSVLAIRNNLLLPNLNFKSPDPECNLNIVQSPIAADIETVLSNSFGFGGANASIVLRSYR